MDILGFVLLAGLATLVLALALIVLVAGLCQLSWPLRALLHRVRARMAMRREFDRAIAQWTHPASR